MTDTSAVVQQQPFSAESFRNLDNTRIRSGLDKITSFLNPIGDTFEKAFEEGWTIVEGKTADIIQETRRFQIRQKGGNTEEQNQAPGVNSSWHPLTQPENQICHETQLKASRDRLQWRQLPKQNFFFGS